MSELQGERVWIGLLTEIEEKLGLRSLLVGRRHEMRDEGFEGGRVRAENRGELSLLVLSRLGLSHSEEDEGFWLWRIMV